MSEAQPTINLEPSFSEDDRRWMRLAIEIARNGLGYVEPNPLVGCVFVNNGDLISQGFHAKFGGPHAERVAIEAAKASGRQSALNGCTAYVTLEPCCHYGKTPPCTDALLEIGVQRVVVAMSDPFPAVSGQGIAQLRQAGIQVDVGLEHDAAKKLLAPYLKRLKTGMPWVIAKWAMSLDGRIATSRGYSQWITCESSRLEVHRLRSRVDAVIVGRGTAQADDPLLTARLPASIPIARVALRVVVDSNASTSAESKLVITAKEFPTLIWTSENADPVSINRLRQAGCRVESSPYPNHAARLQDLLRFLGREYSATNVLVEGGGVLLGSLFDGRLIDQCEVFIAPKLIGGSAAVSPISGIGIASIADGPTLSEIAWQSCDCDMRLSCRVSWAENSNA